MQMNNNTEVLSIAFSWQVYSEVGVKLQNPYGRYLDIFWDNAFNVNAKKCAKKWGREGGDNLVPRILSLPTSRKYPGCGWSRVYVYKSNPHRGWVFDLIVSKLSMVEKVALP